METPDGSEYDDEDDMAGCGDMIESGFKERQDGNRRTRHGSKESLGTAASSAPIIKRNARHEKERIDSEIGTRWVQRQEKESLERDQESEKELEWQKHYPHGWALPFLVAGICAIVFLISLDRTIITTVRFPFPYLSFQPPSYMLRYESEDKRHKQYIQTYTDQEIRQFPQSLPSSAPPTISAGMDLHTF